MKRQIDTLLMLAPLVLLGCVVASVVMHAAGLALISLMGFFASLWLLAKLNDRDQ